MGRGSQRLISAWIPLQDTPLELGGVCIAAGSSTLPGFDAFQRTYVQHDVQRSAVRGATGSSGIFTNDPQELLALDPSLRCMLSGTKASPETFQIARRPRLVLERLKIPSGVRRGVAAGGSQLCCFFPYSLG